MLDALLKAAHDLLFLLLLSLPLLLLLSAERPPPIDLLYLAKATAGIVEDWVRPTPRPPNIDIRRFPHLVEGVMRQADTPTLHAFRLTCRRLRLVANTILAAHVTITDAALLPPAAPGVPFAPQYPDLVPGWRTNLARTRVLDIQYGGAWHPLVREVASLLPRLPSLSLVRVHNSVRELDYTLARRERRLLPDPQVLTVHFHDLACDIRPVQRGSVPYGGGDVFVNLRYSRTRPPAPLGAFDGSTGPSGHTVYLFLTLASAGIDAAPRLNRAGPPAVQKWRALLPYLATQVVSFIVSGSSENTYIFVGDGNESFSSSEVGPGRRSVMTPRDRRTLVELLDAELASLLADGYFAPQAAKNRVERQVGFATFEDVHEMVGDELFALIMAP
jgi:hypothetical protein